MNKELTPLEYWKNFLLLVDAPAKARLFDCGWENGLKQYDYFKTNIETAIKALEIIRTKGIDTDTFRLFHDYEDYQEYMEIYSSFANRYEHYTQEEFYLLKDLLLKKGE